MAAVTAARLVALVARADKVVVALTAGPAAMLQRAEKVLAAVTAAMLQRTEEVAAAVAAGAAAAAAALLVWTPVAPACLLPPPQAAAAAVAATALTVTCLARQCQPTSQAAPGACLPWLARRKAWAAADSSARPRRCLQVSDMACIIS